MNNRLHDRWIPYSALPIHPMVNPVSSPSSRTRKASLCSQMRNAVQHITAALLDNSVFWKVKAHLLVALGAGEVGCDCGSAGLAAARDGNV